MRIAFDSNLLVYLARVERVPGDRSKIDAVRNLIRALKPDVVAVAPYQAFGEAYHVMSRFGYPRALCREIVTDWTTQFEAVASSGGAFLSAIDLATDHKLQFWDALIVNAAADAGCRLLLSEDLQPGFVWRGVTIANPLISPMDPRLTELLDAPQ